MSSAAGKEHPGLLRLLRPLTPLYAAAVAAKNVAYSRGWLSSKQLRAPVISVGNLSVGGAGKTPLIIHLAALLAARGFDVDVLSRGYGRRSNAAEQMHLGADPSSSQHAAACYGDEPLLIAEAAGVPVYVGASRYAAGLLAEQRPCSSTRLHLLDDGFQHRQLARAIDVVVLHRSDFTAGLLPAGRLREPLRALGRASIAVLRVEDAALEREVRRRFPDLPIWRMTREIMLPSLLRATARTGQEEPTLAIAFCGIAHPDEFFASLTRAGVSLAAKHAFRDHHVYTEGDLGALEKSVSATGANVLLTTEKDLVRLSAAHRRQLTRKVALEAVPLRTQLLEPGIVMEQVDQLLALAGFASKT